MDIRRLDVKDKAAFLTFNRDLLADKETNPFVETVEVKDFLAYCEKLQSQEVVTSNLERSSVTTYFSFIDNEIAGKISCRWELDKGNLSEVGGHIGYVTSPKFRRREVMKELLYFSFERYRQRGIRRIFITALKDNWPSRKTIESVGGILQDILAGEDGQELARYWVILKEN